jgi:4-diphosphocytidyl-2-C-methyl-D-erythritol kinase
MMDVLEAEFLAPAKVNLFLCVLGRRWDGFHLLDSLVVPISLCDRVLVRVRPYARSITTGPGVSVTSDSLHAPGGPSNLAHRAAMLLLTAIDRAVWVDVHLYKCIPVGSGLGGGSSDAAAVLLALNALLGYPCSTAQLAAMAAELGADVPFFVRGRAARIGGVGERIAPVNLGAPRALVVCWDGFPLSTRLVYSQLDLSLTSRAPAISIEPLVSGRGPLSEILVNDLEVAAAKIHPEVLSLKAKLVEEGAVGALMTGSGSAVFGMWPDPGSALEAAVRLRQQGLWAEAVQTLNESPAVSG